MPQSPTPNMGLIQPTEGGDDNVWDVILTALFSVVDAHTHAPGSGVKVPTAGLNINADLSFASAYALTNMLAVDFAAVAPAAVAGYAGAFFVNSSDSNNLYFRTVSGSNVKVTDGTSLNVAGFAGGIGGDYASSSALVAYVAANDIYTFKGPDPGSGRPWEALATGHHDFYEQATTVANRVRIQSPAALAASYALTLPAALPAATGRLGVTSAGVISTSTARTIVVSPMGWVGVAGNAVAAAANTESTTGIYMARALDLEVGQQINTVRFRVTDEAGTVLTCYLVKIGTGSLGSAVSSGAGAAQTLTISGLTEDVATGTAYALEVQRTSGAGVATSVSWCDVAVLG